MRKALWIIPLLLFGAIVAPDASADTMTNYTITFTGASPALTPTGSFTYDSTTPAFSNFLVVWVGNTFNLTSSANSPNITALPACLTATSGAAASFSLLTNCASDPSAEWFGSLNPPTATFSIEDGTYDSEGFLTSGIQVSGSTPYSLPTNFFEKGTFEISAVPEPGIISLMLIGIGLALAMRKRIGQGLSQAS